MAGSRPVRAAAAAVAALVISLLLVSTISADFVDSQDFFDERDQCSDNRWQANGGVPPEAPFIGNIDFGLQVPSTPRIVPAPDANGRTPGPTSVSVLAFDCDPGLETPSDPYNPGVARVEFTITGAEARSGAFVNSPSDPCGTTLCRGLLVRWDITTPGVSTINYTMIDREGNRTTPPPITVNIVPARINVTGSLRATPVSVAYDPTPPPPGCLAGRLVITVEFRNVGRAPLQYIAVSLQPLSGILLINANEGSSLNVPAAALGGDGVLSPGESFRQAFVICFTGPPTAIGVEFFAVPVGVTPAGRATSGPPIPILPAR